MKNLVFAALAAVIVLGATSVNAADGVPSDDAMAAMGLSNVKMMSDTEGLAIRGQGVSYSGWQFTAAYTGNNPLGVDVRYSDYSGSGDGVIAGQVSFAYTSGGGYRSYSSSKFAIAGGLTVIYGF